MLFVYTTCADEKEAEDLGTLIIKNKLAACVDHWPVKSVFNWEGGIKKVSQEMMMVTTFEQKLDGVTDLLSKHHSYSVPLVAGVDVRRINRPYKEWMMEEIP